MTTEARVTPGGEVRVLRAPGPGPALVLLHGAAGNAATWGPTLAAWSRADVWAPDLPGRGGSPGPARESADALAGWLLELADAFGWERPILVGHSLGGAIALTFALRYPDRLGGLVMVSSSARLRVAPAILEAAAGATADAPLPMDFAFPPTADRPIVARYSALSRDTPPEATLADWLACNRFDVRERLGEVSAPTLVVHGDQDPLTPAKHQRSLAEAIPGAQRVEIGGRGHMLPWEDAPALAEAVLRWSALSL